MSRSKELPFASTLLPLADAHRRSVYDRSLGAESWMYLHQLQIRCRRMVSPSVRRFLFRGTSKDQLHIAAGRVKRSEYDALQTFGASQGVVGFSLVVSRQR